MSETPAETIRQAARLMRERAEAATPGPWAVAEPTEREGHRVGTADERDWVAWTGDLEEEFSPADAANIASWHPLVALAVAEWLDNEAASAELCTDARDTAGVLGLPDTHAVAVARAYLGEGCMTPILPVLCGGGHRDLDGPPASSIPR